MPPRPPPTLLDLDSRVDARIDEAAARRPLTRAALEEGCAHLRRRDPALGRWIERVGPVTLRRQRHRFGALCRAIISQQLGAAAARTIHGRFIAALAPAARAEPEAVLALNDARLRACGLSAPKARYLRALAAAFAGELRSARLGALSDREVVEMLTRLPGVGVWTAEMFLIFSLGRRDVFSIGDLALRNAVGRVAGRPLAAPAILERAARWAPYRSVACLFLWRIAHWREPGAAGAR